MLLPIASTLKLLTSLPCGPVLLLSSGTLSATVHWMLWLWFLTGISHWMCPHWLRKSAPNQWHPPSPFPWPRPLRKSAISPLPPFPFPHIILPLHLPFQPLYPQPHTLSTRACQVGSKLNAPSLPSHLACGFENWSFSSQVHHTEPWNKKASSMTFLSPSLIFMMEEEATLWMCRGHVLVASMFPAPASSKSTEPPHPVTTYGGPRG